MVQLVYLLCYQKREKIVKSLIFHTLCRIEYLPSKQRVAGSSPAGAAKNPRKINGFSVYPFDNTMKKGKTHVFWRIQENTSKTKTDSVFPFSRVSPFVSPERKREMSIRKINTKQLTAIKPIIKWGKKKFYFRYYCPDLQKDNVRKFADTEAEAKVLREQIKERQVLGSSTPAGAHTPIGVIRDKWLDMMQLRVDDGHLAQSTLDGYRDAHLSLLDPYVEESVQNINAPMIRAIFKKMAWNDGRAKSYNTKGKVFARIKAMLEYAIKHGYLAPDHIYKYVEEARPITVQPDEVQIPSETSVKKLIECSDDFWKPFFLLVASTGLRCGEAVALPWRNVRLNEGIIRIDRARKADGTVGPPKTKKGIRELFLPQALAKMFSDMPRKSDLVFPLPEFQDKRVRASKSYAPQRLREENEYKMMTVEQVCANGLKPTVDKNRIDWPDYDGDHSPRIKCLRHFAASKMIALGYDAVTVQRRLGHAKAETTLNIYAHLWERNKFKDEGEDMVKGLL